jgi:hypothetical protein
VARSARRVPADGRWLQRDDGTGWSSHLGDVGPHHRPATFHLTTNDPQDPHRHAIRSDPHPATLDLPEAPRWRIQPPPPRELLETISKLRQPVEPERVIVMNLAPVLARRR